MFIVIGDRDTSVYFMAKAEPKSKRPGASFWPAGRVRRLVKAQPRVVSSRPRPARYLHIYPMVESGHQTPYLRNLNT